MANKKPLHIVKIGGHVIEQPLELDLFLNHFNALKGLKILVHGGGKLATQLATKLNVPTQMLDGRRVTDAETLKIITMTYAGYVNKNIVAGLQAKNCQALGFTGADGNAILSVKRASKPVDYGFVGDITQVNSNLFHQLIASQIVPVVCAITHDGNGQLLNTNADSIAAEIAKAMSEQYEVSLHYCFEKIGVLQNIQDESSLIEQIDNKKYQALLDENIIADGMLPKMKNCFEALQGGVQKVCIGKPKMLSDSNFPKTTLTL